MASRSRPTWMMWNWRNWRCWVGRWPWAGSPMKFTSPSTPRPSSSDHYIFMYHLYLYPIVHNCNLRWLFSIINQQPCQRQKKHNQFPSTPNKTSPRKTWRGPSPRCPSRTMMQPSWHRKLRRNCSLLSPRSGWKIPLSTRRPIIICSKVTLYSLRKWFRGVVVDAGGGTACQE